MKDERIDNTKWRPPRRTRLLSIVHKFSITLRLWFWESQNLNVGLALSNPKPNVDVHLGTLSCLNTQLCPKFQPSSCGFKVNLKLLIFYRREFGHVGSCKFQLLILEQGILLWSAKELKLGWSLSNFNFTVDL